MASRKFIYMLKSILTRILVIGNNNITSDFGQNIIVTIDRLNILL